MLQRVLWGNVNLNLPIGACGEGTGVGGRDVRQRCGTLGPQLHYSFLGWNQALYRKASPTRKMAPEAKGIAGLMASNM
jgi:hypothetical protein